MAFKINIQPDLEEEITTLLKKTTFRSKTEYINQAIRAFNHQLKRQVEIAELKKYLTSYRNEGRDILHEFNQTRNPRH